MQNPEELAEEALKFLDNAQKSEEERNFKKAIANYQQAMEFLKQSGYLLHRVDDIYERINELQKMEKQEQFYQQTQLKSQIEQLQDQAFALLEGAKQFELDGFFEDAIAQYYSAINLLGQAGWSNTQLENLRLKIKGISDTLKKEQVIQESRKQELSAPDEFLQELDDQTPEVVGMFGQKKSIEKTESVAKYRARRKKEEEIQNHAFNHIDKAKDFEREKKFDNAIENYERAIELLDSIGWDEQTKNILVIIEKLKTDKQQFEIFEKQRKSGPTELLRGDLVKEAAPESEIKKKKLIEFEKIRNKEEQVQTNAFNLIDIGKRLEREKNYDEAIQKFEQATNLFRSIDWDSYIHPILGLIEDIKKRRDREKNAKYLKERRQQELTTLQESIYRKQKESVVESAKDLAQKRKDIEEKQIDLEKKEKDFFTLLSFADTLLSEKKYDEAIGEYQKALNFIKELGGGWETYSTNINNTIINVQKIKNSQLQRKYEVQQKLDKRKASELEFQKQIAVQLNKERERLNQEEIIIKDREKESVYFEQRKNVAFDILDSATKLVSQGDYENAIKAYQNAGSIFSEIHWREEIPLIEKSIREVEEIQRNQRFLKQQKMQEALEREKEEITFQKQIADSLRLERERIKQKEVEVKKRDEELKFREERREAGFKLLDQAQEEVSKGDYDNAIEILHYATNFFAEAHWKDEINLIQNSIIEIETKKRNVELQKQIQFQAQLEKEKQEKDFQERLVTEIKTRQQRLKQREIVLREREKEIAFREGKKEEAFRLLDDTQNLIPKGNYDVILENYYKVIAIFAQIQWNDEIPIIQEAIRDIETRKNEEAIIKQRQLERSIKKEIEDKAYFDKIKYQREIEAAISTRSLEQDETQKILHVEALAKQQQAFKFIESGEIQLQEENFDASVKSYQDAIKILNEIGWEKPYLTLLNDTIATIQNRKKEKELEKKKAFDLALKNQKREERLQKKISEAMKMQQERIKVKEIQLLRKEEMLEYLKKRKIDAFNAIDKAEALLSENQYNQSIKEYRNAEIILTEINFPTDIIKDMIYKIEEKRREDLINKSREFESNFRKEQEEKLFQQQITEKVRLEQLKLIDKQDELRKQEEYRQLTEEKRDEAFNILETAQSLIVNGQYNEAIESYRKAASIFAEIQWDDEIKLIQDSIEAVKNKKRESEIRKQQELEEAINQEKMEKAFQEQIAKEISIQRERFKQKEIVLRDKEKELAFREKQKEAAFNLLDKSQELISQGKYDEALEIYHTVTNTFAQLQWIDEIPIIQEAIREIEDKKNEQAILKQRELENALNNEKANYDFMKKISLQKANERAMALKEIERVEQDKLISSQNLKKQQTAISLIDRGESLLKQYNFDEAISNYQTAIGILTEIGWTDEYLKLLYETITTIELRKQDLEGANVLNQQLLAKQRKEEQDFNAKIYGYIQKEKKKFEEKKIEIQKRENRLQNLEGKKLGAFKIMDKGEEFLNNGHYDQALSNYRQAELILNEIGFPTGSIVEMINKIQEKQREKLFATQKNMEMQLQQEREQLDFQMQIAKTIRIKEKMMEEKHKRIEAQHKQYEYMENRKTEAFELLEEAEMYMNQARYDKSLEYYHSAELILNEIAFPTEVVREMIQKVQEKRREQQLQKQKDLDIQLAKEKQEWEIQQNLAENLRKEQERLRIKKIQIEEMAEVKSKLERRRQDAFKILDEAENVLKKSDYTSAIRLYRKAELILNELNFPTASIKNMVQKVTQMMKQREEEEELKFQQELQKVEEEKDLQLLIDERQRQEREKKRAQLLAIQEREKAIQEEVSIRESAYSMLEEAGKYLKQLTPDYDRAISLYNQAKNILAEHIGWEPEINNLNALIKDLQQEQINFKEKKRLEEEARIQRQKEYDLFQEEIKKRRLEQEKIKREQERQYRELIQGKRHIEDIREDGLKYLDEGKRWAAYHDFKQAYENFEKGIEKFREIGWVDEIKYIETEIKNTKKLEQRVISEESKIRSIQEQLEKQRKVEESRRKSEDAHLKKTITEVSDLAGDVIKIIEERRNGEKLAEEMRLKQISIDAKEFRKKMSDLIKVKQELKEELEKKEGEKRKIQEKMQQAKEREEVNALKRMIKEAKEKKK